MKPANLAQRLEPTQLVQLLTRHSAMDIAELFGSTQFLLVEEDPQVPDLLEGLQHTSTDTRVQVEPSLTVLDYQTASIAGIQLVVSQLSEVNVETELLERLESHKHFIIPICKRAGSESAFASRVGVGRALNKDIVLRHPTVSKFHAWFESDESGGVFLFDAGSRNGTSVNGKQLQKGESHWVQPLEVIELGSVRAFACPPEQLFHALHQHAPH